MNTSILATNPENFIFASNDDLRTTSLKVAEAFGKLHKDVLRKIQTLDCSPEFNQRNFAPVEYVDAKGEKRAAYEMTKDGFMFLVMGFTGKAAAQIKEAYINAFNLMHDKIFPKVKPRLLSELTDEERWEMVVERWGVFIDIYGSQLTNQYDYQVPRVWEEALGNLSSADFKRGIEAIKNSASPYMPKLPVFIAYCKDAEVVTAKEGLTISEMKEKLGLPCENREDILKHVEFQELRINGFMDLLLGMKRSAEIMKSALQA
jgi:Rha family phage regulatory protein